MIPQADFITCLKVVYACEGPPAYGVEQTIYDVYRRRHQEPVRPVALITDTERIDLYKSFYWDPYRLGALRGDWAMFCLVEGVNLPWRDAIRLMQGVMLRQGLYEGIIDGDIGPDTISAVARSDPTSWQHGIDAAVGHYAITAAQQYQTGLIRRRLDILSAGITAL